MGSGANARRNSKIAISMLERLLSSGFEKETSINLINSAIMNANREEMYATLDIEILDLYAGKMEVLKNGACPTFIKQNREVSMLKSTSLPTGIINDDIRSFLDRTYSYKFKFIHGDDLKLDYSQLVNKFYIYKM